MIKIFDTETGSRYLVPQLRRAGISIDPQTDVIRGRSLTGLAKLMDTMGSPNGSECYMKIGLEGFAGSGKSFTSAQFAIGLQKIDPTANILLIDSITHIWQNVVKNYKEKHGGKHVSFKGWGEIKELWWREYSERLVFGKYNIIFTGRAGYTYDTILDGDGKIEEIVKTGIKMKVEGDTEYEPDLLLLMERQEEILGKKKRIWRTATILKDRSDIIDGEVFDDPTFEHIKPVWNFLNGDEIPEMPDRDTQTDHDIVGEQEERNEEKQQKEIILEKIWAEFDGLGLGNTKEGKVVKTEIFERIFMTKSKKEVELMPLAQLTAVYESLLKDPDVIKYRELAKEALNAATT